MSTTSTRVTGSCLCGRITLTIDELERDVVYCHCTQCRKQSGHHFAASRVRDGSLHVSGAEHLTWFAASAEARRGFCSHCGSVLFWKLNDYEYTSVLAGCLDAPTGLKAVSHIYTADKGDYYTLDDALPQYARSD